MEEKREAGVWQRVLTHQEKEAVWDLQGLLREVEALAAVYKRLSGPLARRLWEGERANGDCLRGIARLRGESMEAVQVWEPAGKNSLMGCYHRTRRCQAEYTARVLDPEFGEVFRQMADREAMHCTLLTQLLGQSGRMPEIKR